MASLAFGQEGVQFGVNISPAWKLNTHKNRLTTLRSNETGYGFTAGIPIRYWLNEYSSFDTGLDYEFTAFDNFENGFLVSSFRFNSLNLPLVFNRNIKGNWFGKIGSGFVYNGTARGLNTIGGNGESVIDDVNRVQPYFALGLSSLSERGSGFFEIGALARYQLLDIWKADKAPNELLTSHILAFDFVLRFYF